MQGNLNISNFEIGGLTLDSHGSALYTGFLRATSSDTLTLRGVPKNLVPSSVRIPGTNALRLTSVKLQTPLEYFKLLGEGVQVRVVVPQANYFGILLEHRDNNVKILVDKMVVEIVGSFEVIYPKPSNGDVMVSGKEPTLQLRFNQMLSPSVKVPLTLRAHGLQWSGSHQITIQSNLQTLDWNFLLTLDNQTDLELRDVDVKLVVSDASKPGYYAAARALPQSVFGGGGGQESSSGNTIIPIGKIEQIQRGESALTIYSSLAIPFRSALVYSIQEGSKHPSRVIKFRQQSSELMAFPASSGEWNIDEQDFGTFNMDYLAPRQICRLNLGSYSLVEVKSRVNQIQNGRQEVMIWFKNNSSRPLFVFVEMTKTQRNPVFREALVQTSEELSFFEDGLLETVLIVKTPLVQPESTVTVSYTEDVPT